MQPPGAIVTERSTSIALDLDERPAEHAQSLVHPCLHPPLGTGRAAAPPAVLQAPVEDDLDLVLVGQRSDEVLVELLVVPRDDEPITPHATSAPPVRRRDDARRRSGSGSWG